MIGNIALRVMYLERRGLVAGGGARATTVVRIRSTGDNFLSVSSKLCVAYNSRKLGEIFDCYIARKEKNGHNFPSVEPTIELS